MKLSTTILFLLISLFCLNASGSARHSFKCVRRWRACRFRTIGRCTTFFWVRIRRCRRLCRFRFGRRRCFRRCGRIWVRQHRRGFRCPLRRSIPVPQPQPPTQVPGQPCAEVCYRRWITASRLGCDLSRCLIRRCARGTTQLSRDSWKCSSLITPTPSTVAVTRIAIANEETQKKSFGTYFK